MTLEELQEAVESYFGDTSRPQQETADGLREIADMCNVRAEMIENDLENGQ